MKTSKKTPAVDMKNCKLVQVGCIVDDTIQTAHQFYKVLGLGPWLLADDTIDKLVLHGRPVTDNNNANLRTTVSNLGDMQIELIQQTWGEGTWGEYYQKHGKGAQHMSFGIVEKYEELVSALEEHGVEMECKGEMGGCITACYMDTTELLGTRLELVRTPDGIPTLGQWGIASFKGPVVSNMSAGKVEQVGIVVRDAVQTAKNYEEILGIGPWTFLNSEDVEGLMRADCHQIDVWNAASSDDTVTDAMDNSWSYRGVSMLAVDMPLKIAYCNWEGLVLKLIQPLAGPNSYWEYLKTHGNGIHHLSFGYVDNYDEMISTFTAAGIDVEMSGTFGNGGKFTHLATYKDLGVYLEFGKKPLSNEPLI